MAPIGIKELRREGILGKILKFILPYHFPDWDDPYWDLEKGYQQELVFRGNVPQDLWSQYMVDDAIKNTLIKILQETIWGQDADFHPKDPFYVIGGLQTADLSESNVLIEIEKALGIKLTQEVVEIISKMQFYEVISMFTKLRIGNQ